MEIIYQEAETMRDRLSMSASFGPNPRGARTDVSTSHEVLVEDVRAQLRPAEVVERKLMNLLRTVPMPVSHMSGAFRKR